MSSFTEGDWKFTPYMEIKSNGRLIALLSCDTLREDYYERAQGNGRLIAAAPEMYKLLERLAYGDYNDCLSLTVKAKEILESIDGK